MALSYLQSLGISAAPDPSQYANQVAVAGQMTQAKADMNGTISSLSTAIGSLNDVPGLPTDLTDSLVSLKDQASILANSTNATPAQLEQQRQQIEAKMKEVEAKKELFNQQTKVKEAEEVVDAIQAKVDEVVEDKTLSAALVAKYNDLLARAKANLRDENAKLTAISSKAEGFQVIGPAPMPAGITQRSINLVQDLYNELAELEQEREKETDKEFNIWRFGSRIGNQLLVGLQIAAILVGFVAGGIILSNAYLDPVKGYAGTRLFYFFYGALFFPLVLLYGVFKPPKWRATIVPLYMMDPANPGVLDTLFGYRPFTPGASGAAASDPLAGQSSWPIRLVAIFGLGLALVAGAGSYVKKFRDALIG